MSLKKRLLQAIARLASVKYQEAYIVGGTADEYVLPEDVLEDVASLCSLTAQAQYRDNFSTDQHEKINALLLVVRKYGRPIFTSETAMNAEELVRDNEHWKTARSEAARCLMSFGFDIDEVPVDRIDDTKSNVFNSP